MVAGSEEARDFAHHEGRAAGVPPAAPSAGFTSGTNGPAGGRARPRSLRVRRLQVGWTQEQLAAEVHCNHRTISHIERGELRPSAGLLERIERALADRERSLIPPPPC